MLEGFLLEYYETQVILQLLLLKELGLQMCINPFQLAYFYFSKIGWLFLPN